MARPMPQAFPRQIITLLSILLVILLIAFPSSSSIVVTLVLLGGAVFFLQSKASRKGTREVEMQPMEAAIQAAMMKQSTQGRQLPSEVETAQTAEIELTPVKPASKAADSTGAEAFDKDASPAQIAAAEKPEALRSDERIANGHSKEQGSAPASDRFVAPVQREDDTVRNSASTGKPTLENGSIRNVASQQSKPANGTAAPLAGGAAVLARLR